MNLIPEGPPSSFAAAALFHPGSHNRTPLMKAKIQPQQEGMYRVCRGRALHWPSQNGKPMIWARHPDVVDLTSPFLCELVQKTGQLHKLEKMEAEDVGPKDRVIRASDCPPSIRAALLSYEQLQPHAPKAMGEFEKREAGRQIDMDQLPSVGSKPVAETKPAEAPRTQKAAGKVGLGEKAPEKAPEKPSTSSDRKGD